MVDKKKTKKRKTKVKEVFEVGPKGKEKVVEKTGTVEEVVSRKNQIKEENKILQGIFIVIGLIVIFFIGFYFGPKINSNFEFAGLEWDIMKEGPITFYHTQFPTSPTNMHNVYFRNDPRKLVEEIPFEGELNLKKMIAMAGLDDFNCEGDGIISQASMEQVLNAWGAEVIYDSEASCDIDSRYTFIRLVPGEETKIEEFLKDCYMMQINDCEVLKAKERLILEGIILSNF